MVTINAFLNFLKSNRWILTVAFFILSVIISIISINSGVNNFWGGNHTYYNNYVIFKQSFIHLIENKNLYEYYPNEYADLYKYSPTFAAIMSFFYYLPDSIGLVIWNFLNVFVLYYAIVSLKNINPTQQNLLLLFLIFEIILTTQNSQSNALLAGLTIMTFNALEKGKNNYAALFLIIGTFIKIYSVVGILLFLLYPNKIKSILYLTMWTIIFLLIPLLLINFSELVNQYKNWYVLLKTDQSASIGMSLYAFTQHLFSINYFKIITLLLGVVTLFAPLIKYKNFTSSFFRINYLCLILIWMVVLNYKAESPTFIIALAGIGIWFFANEKSKIKTILALSALFFTSIWFTDIVPRAIKTGLIDFNYVKSFFPIVILFTICFELLVSKKLNDN